MIRLPEIIGLPPGSHIESERVRNSGLPVMEIIPCEPEFSEGITLFKLKESYQKYMDLLSSHGFEMYEPGRPLKIAFMVDTLPSDTFTNEYGESFLNKLTDVISQGSAEVAQIIGARSAGEFMSKIYSAAKDQGGIAGMLASGAKGAFDMFSGAANSLGQSALGSKFEATKGLMDQLLVGSRIDFPQVWKNSTFTPQYSFTIKLFNPYPKNEESTKKHLLGPLAAILLLGLPYSMDGETYNWPFLNKTNCRGLFNLRAGYVGNITVQKGGDQHSVGWNQRIGEIDIRMDMGSLFDSILAGYEDYASDERPTLGNYLQIMMEEKQIVDVMGIPDSTGPLLRGQTSPGIITAITEAADRVSSTVKSTTDGLVAAMGGLF